jgi:hypothetical protein
MLMLEVPIEQIADAIRRMDEKERYTLLNLVLELKEPIAFATTITYYREELGYLARCLPIDAVAWGDSLDDARESLIDSVIEMAETLVEDCPNPDEDLRQRLYCAQIIYENRQSRNKVNSLLGFCENAVYIS